MSLKNDNFIYDEELRRDVIFHKLMGIEHVSMWLIYPRPLTYPHIHLTQISIKKHFCDFMIGFKNILTVTSVHQHDVKGHYLFPYPPKDLKISIKKFICDVKHFLLLNV